MQVREDHIHHINVLSSYLATAQNAPVHPTSGSVAYVLIGSAILPTLEAVYDRLSAPQEGLADGSALGITIVLSGGIGHSTQLLRDAVARHPKYCDPQDDITDLPESRIFELLLRCHWPTLQDRIDRGEIRLLVDDQSTNCGANARESISILAAARPGTLDTLVVVQDPTMMRRTMASFEKVLDDDRSLQVSQLVAWPTFVPHLATSDGEVKWRIEAGDGRRMGDDELWKLDRFLDLILGEIPRLRDDKDGYGPNGKRFIAHVDVPVDVQASWAALAASCRVDR